MGDKLRKLTIAVLLAGSAAVLLAAPAEASREPTPTSSTTEPSYVPPPKYGQNPHPVLPPEPDPYAGATPPVIPVVPVVLPQVTSDPGSPASSPGDQNAGNNSGRGVAPGDKITGADQAIAPAAAAFVRKSRRFIDDPRACSTMSGDSFMLFTSSTSALKLEDPYWSNRSKTRGVSDQNLRPRRPTCAGEPGAGGHHRP